MRQEGDIEPSIITSSPDERRRGRIHVEGIVQGVGFRPFVHALANRLGLRGFIANDPGGVMVEVEGAATAVMEFVSTLRSGGPPLAIVEHIACEWVPLLGERTFEIAQSRIAGDRRVLVSPDIATCADCLREIFDPADRRFRYAFTNCTNCGPRLRLIDRNRIEHPGDPIETTAKLLRAGYIVAVKGLGGYHLAAAAANEAAVAALRSRKHREDKPFALMAPDIADVRQLVELNDVEERLLNSSRRPIVLLRRRTGAKIAKSVAGMNRRLGLMLPYTPIHHLLCYHFGAPLVLTSGNYSDEPIACTDDDALQRLARLPIFFCFTIARFISGPTTPPSASSISARSRFVDREDMRRNLRVFMEHATADSGMRR